jgi:hypothetical protein
MDKCDTSSLNQPFKKMMGAMPLFKKLNKLTKSHINQLTPRNKVSGLVG